MKHLALVLLAATLSSCRTGDPAAGHQAGADQAPIVESPMEGLEDVMQAKLVHAGSLLEGITLQDFAQVRHHADALTWLSQRSDWMVHTTEAYAVFSDRFQEVTRKMSVHAAARDIDALTGEYVALTASCVECHEYLRREGLTRQLPGSVARADFGPGVRKRPG